MERLGDGSQVVQVQAQGQGQRQVRRQVALTVEMAVEPSGPHFFEFDAGHDLVTGLKGRGQARFQRPFAQQVAGEGVEGGYIRPVQVGDPPAAPVALGLVPPVIDGCRFQYGPDAVSQLGGGGFGEGDGGDVVQGGRSSSHQVGDPLNEAGGFAGAGAGFNEQRGAEVLSNDFPGVVIDRDEA